MGHDAVAVLDGGLPKWLREGRPTESGAPGTVAPADGPEVARDPCAVADADAVARALETGSAQVLDARSRPRFRGEAPEPRPGLRAGHMPGAFNLPFGEVLNPDGTMKDEDGLRAALAAEGIDPAGPSSPPAARASPPRSWRWRSNGWAARAALYDGSWAEWGADPPPAPSPPDPEDAHARPLKDQPADAILSLMAAFRADPRADKIDLGVGVYKDAEGAPPSCAPCARPSGASGRPRPPRPTPRWRATGLPRRDGGAGAGDAVPARAWPAWRRPGGHRRGAAGLSS
jgi:rhodanese-related sulfurtransferase